MNGFSGFDAIRVKWWTDRAEETIQFEAQRAKRKENTENNVRNKKDLVKDSEFCKWTTTTTKNIREYMTIWTN